MKILPSDKASAGGTPTKIIKESKFWYPELTNCFSEPLTNNKVPDTLKLSDPSDNENYRPISIMPLVTEVFEKIMYDQFYEYIENFLDQLLCGFRKAHST